MSISLNHLTEKIKEQAREKGWGVSKDDILIPEKIALIHSEVSEAYEAYRKGTELFPEELADIVMRVLHLCGCLGIDIEKEILQKLEKNGKRDWKELKEGI